MSDTQSTHSDDCYKWHHDCAIARIERLEEEVDQHKAWKKNVELTLRMYHSDVFDTIKYRLDEAQKRAKIGQ